MKVFHINILDDEQAVKELNDPKTGGWSSSLASRATLTSPWVAKSRPHKPHWLG